jgi:hypothetical protein
MKTGGQGASCLAHIIAKDNPGTPICHGRITVDSLTKAWTAGQPYLSTMVVEVEDHSHDIAEWSLLPWPGTDRKAERR